jgi:hypothetical protein
MLPLPVGSSREMVVPAESTKSGLRTGRFMEKALPVRFWHVVQWQILVMSGWPMTS